MPGRRGRRGSIADLLPQDPAARLRWARGIWAYQAEVAQLDSGPWLLREAGRILGHDEETVDAILRRR